MNNFSFFHLGSWFNIFYYPTHLYGTVPGMGNISTSIFLNKTMGFKTIFNDIHRGYMHIPYVTCAEMGKLLSKSNFR
jgi:hypothetical protein